ncbi:MAG TPA: Eco57I restriction-modification methylase domain-containing protein [Candidatus Dormibacteraeota bacterium]|nr:Eco57I restriction-modification methylase domain-containing protein [Candidatus Dormibacteraeota bacterium]
MLEPLFHDVLAVPGDRRAAATASIPFLNGGLFERRYGEVSLDLPDALFDLDTGLLGYLNHWTFTVAEETADEQEVAVDPEMLGRVFESLLPDAEREQKGTYYTPRPVVQFMCREALIARLAREGLGEDLLRELLTDEDPAHVLRGQRQARELARELDGRLAELTVLDPAVGSGAFLLGMMGEITRLRAAAHEVVHGVPATTEQLHAWKLHAIERTLFGVDIEATAVELCRLRLWLSLAVELDPSRPAPPLPNLEFRTVCANSLVDFVEGVELQDTRRAARSPDMFLGLDVDEVVRLRAEYFGAAHPERKAALRNRLLDAENRLLDELLGDRFGKPRREAEAKEKAKRITQLKEQLRSPDRVYPIFIPAFSAPEVWGQGGWDVVIMNPPYVGRKQLAERYREQPQVVDAVQRHFGATNDLMVLFGERALQLARPGGVIAMIFNDSIFTSTDAEAFRRRLVDQTTLRVLARTKCFEGQVVNGGVIVARTDPPSGAPVRWVEGYRRPTEDFAGASLPVEGAPGEPTPAGAMEVFRSPLEAYQVLPHRPLYRPSGEALRLRERYAGSVRWSEFADPGPKGWAILSNPRALERRVEELREVGLYPQLRPGDWVLLGLVTEGGQGLATADDRRFLAAVEGTEAAEEHRRFQERLERLTLDSRLASEYRTLLRDHGDRERALLALWQAHGGKRPCPLPWPRTGTFRIVPRERVHTGPVSVEERRSGIAGPACFIPFEKGDQSQELEDEEGRVTRIGAAWVRDNPLVIDWSQEAVALLRRRAAGAESAQKPYFRNEHLWFQAGVTWNSLARYLRARLAPEGSIFGHMAPLLRPLPWVGWLSPLSLLALLNSDVTDFLLRTFLGSLMHIEVGDLRRLVVPVLSPAQKADLERFAERAIAARRGQSDEPLATIEAELDAYVRDLYGVPRTADLWVVR